MEVELLELPVPKTSIESLTINKAIDFYNSLMKSPYCKSINYYAVEDICEIICFDIEAELGQYRVNDIRKIERLCVQFWKDDDIIPFVYALRKGFPKVKHRNSVFNNWPECLCIYETPYEELKVTWTPNAFLEDIRNWLSKTAKDKLHQEDQQLEPFLLDFDGYVVLPRLINNDDYLQGFIINTTIDGKPFYYFRREEYKIESNSELFVLSLVGQPQTHGIINNKPRTLSDLNDFLVNAQINLVDSCIGILKNIKEKNSKELEKFLLINVILPKKRYENSSDITTDQYVFHTNDTLKTLGEKFGIWEIFKENNYVAYILNPSTPEKKQLETISVCSLKPLIEFDKYLAQILNNTTSGQDINFFTIGLGALGSQVFMNLCRSGFGRWTLIDDDLFMPHNLARHALKKDAIGKYKVNELSNQANYLINDNTFSYPIVANILREKRVDTLEKINKILQLSDIVLDMSASIGVSRMIANDKRFENKRKISLFLNPNGTQLVILGEDYEFKYKLDYLEVCYYRELLTNSNLIDHFKSDLNEVRYSTSCRDISSRIPQENISIFAAISASALKKDVCRKEAVASIWKFDETNYTTCNTTVRLGEEIIIVKNNNWEIIYDDILLEKISIQREKKTA